MEPTFSMNNSPMQFAKDQQIISQQMQHVLASMTRCLGKIGKNHGKRTRDYWQNYAEMVGALQGARAENRLLADASAYSRDAGKRTIQMLDILRARADDDAEREAIGTPPVLIYDYNVVMDGSELPQPVNYKLARIVPPEGVKTYDWKRPYMIIDPRAGQSAGIGGFKPDSQVGVALRDGHPVYFCIFDMHPVKGQTMADVTRAEAEFVREIVRLHPDSPKPVIVGNCQGGWATAMLAATNPDITGPLVLNGSPMSYWSGRIGENPMRYHGGMLGGLACTLLMSDMSNGQFDGANLVSNFEWLNPGRNFFGKYYDVFADIEGQRERFLEFERWWGGYCYMNEAEIRWIVEELFVGNKLARGEAVLDAGNPVDLKAIRAPIIVFCSWGDNITPPQQALNWIPDTYTSVEEIKIAGQRIIYIVDDKVGHLGIFVSSKIARKEHAEFVSTLKTIEALAPGLYEMKIENVIEEGSAVSFDVSFAERTFDDIAKYDDDRSEEAAFAAVKRVSEIGAGAYDMLARPFVQSMVTPQSAEMLRLMHPDRTSRRIFSSKNPVMFLPATLAKSIDKEETLPVAEDNPFRMGERLMASGIEQAMDLWRDLHDMAYEMTFLSVYGSPYMQWVGRSENYGRAQLDPAELRYLPQAREAMANIATGGFAEAIVRICLLLTQATGSVNRKGIDLSAHVLTKDEPFATLGAQACSKIIAEQGIIVSLDKDEAIATLDKLLPEAKDRRKAIETAEYLANSVNGLSVPAQAMLRRIRKELGLPGQADAPSQFQNNPLEAAGTDAAKAKNAENVSKLVKRAAK